MEISYYKHAQQNMSSTGLPVLNAAKLCTALLTMRHGLTNANHHNSTKAIKPTLESKKVALNSDSHPF